MSDYDRVNRLYRIKSQGIICGICAGIADFFGLNVILVRLFAIAMLILFTPVTFVVYIALRLLLSEKPECQKNNVPLDDFYRGVRRSPAGTVNEIGQRFANLDKRLQGIETYVTSKQYQFDQEIKRG